MKSSTSVILKSLRGRHYIWCTSRENFAEEVKFRRFTEPPISKVNVTANTTERKAALTDSQGMGFFLGLALPAVWPERQSVPTLLCMGLLMPRKMGRWASKGLTAIQVSFTFLEGDLKTSIKRLKMSILFDPESSHTKIYLHVHE